MNCWFSTDAQNFNAEERIEKVVDYSSIETRIQELEQRYSAIPSVAEPPATTLDIIGESRREGNWEALLVYFLKSDNPHGFETDVLRAFLDALESHTETTFSPRAYDIEHVTIESQVATGQGIPDALIWVDQEWFICLELKVASQESNEQTVRYADAAEFGDLTVSTYDPANSHYFYIAPDSATKSTSEAFVDISWEHIVDSLEDLLITAQGRYPAKSGAQYADFIDTIKEELNMTDYEEYKRDKALLGIKYSDAIREVNKAFTEVLEDERQSWSDDFRAAVASTDRTWITDQSLSKYAQVFPPAWVYFGDSNSVPESNKDGLTSVNYECEINETNLAAQELTIIFKSVKHDDDDLRAHVDEYIAEKVSEIERDYDINRLSGNSRKIFRFTVPFNLEAGHTVGGRMAHGILKRSGLTDELTVAFQNAVESYEE